MSDVNMRRLRPVPILLLTILLLALLSACAGGNREAEAAVPPTCTETGVSESIGPFGIRRTETIPPTGHTPAPLTDTRPTCTEDGHTGGTACTVCGEIIGAPTVLPAPGHSPSPLPETPASCTAAGQTGGSVCTVCGETVDAPTILLPLEHTPDVTPGKAPTCTRSGVTDSAVCTVCGRTLRTAETIPAAGHEWKLKSLVTTTETKDAAGNMECTVCGAKRKKTITSADLGAPIVRLTGNLALKDKEARTTVGFAFESPSLSFTCRAEMSIQGGTAATFEKKNYNVRLLREDGTKYKVRLDNDWGWQSRYCMKANFVDFTQARNIVSGRIWSGIIASRGADDPQSRLPNGGAVDGFACAVYLNGHFIGMYTINIPKDEWMFGMTGGEDAREAVIMGSDWTSTVALSKKLPAHGTENWDGMTLVYCSTEDTPTGTDWVNTSFNKMTSFVRDSSDAAFRKGISKYVNVDRAIDALLYTTAFHGNDNVSKNVLWVTWDGQVWSPSPYDMDDSWGLVWNGTTFYSATDFSFSEVASRNELWKRLWSVFRPEIEARWKELRAGPLSTNTVRAAFSEFINGVPDVLYEADAARWNSPSEKTSTYKQIAEYTAKRLKWLDGKMK